MFYSTAFLHEKYLGLNKAFMSKGSFTHPICKKSRLSMDRFQVLINQDEGKFRLESDANLQWTVSKQG